MFHAIWVVPLHDIENLIFTCIANRKYQYIDYVDISTCRHLGKYIIDISIYRNDIKISIYRVAD